MFVERTEDPVKEPKKTPTPPKIGNTTTPVVPIITPTVSVTAPSVQVSGDDMAKFNAHFDELFDQANLPGPDFYEFTKMCTAMAALPDETKYSAVFAGLQVQGLTKEKLLESANHYIAIIDEDSKKFNSTIDTKIVADAQAKLQEVEKRKAAVLQKQQLIEQMQNEILQENQNIANLAADANEQQRKATEKTTIYKAAADTRKMIITNEINKISTYVK